MAPPRATFRTTIILVRKVEMAILTKKRRVSGVLAAALMAGAAVTVTAQAAPELALDHGHVDAFNVSYTGGGLTLDLKEDVTGQHVRHAPESVKLVVKEEALTDIPSGFPGAPKAYFLPITQNPKLVWPGWDTLGVSGSGIEKHQRQGRERPRRGARVQLRHVRHPFPPGGRRDKAARGH